MTNSTDNARRIEAALKLMRQMPLEPEPEIFEISCYCALRDEPYTLRFTLQENGLFRLKESIPVIRSETPSRSCGYVPASKTLNMDRLEATAFPCAWCGDRSFHYCRSHCGAFVCGGRMQGNTFHCRKSCGASWVGTAMKKLQGSTGSPAGRSTVAPESKAPSVNPAPDRLRLGAGSTLVKRG
ncbi:MAG: hypothetical protein ABR910_13005 [Acidobacteriaceae bacterium]